MDGITSILERWLASNTVITSAVKGRETDSVMTQLSLPLLNTFFEFEIDCACAAECNDTEKTIDLLSDGGVGFLAKCNQHDWFKICLKI